MPMIFIRKRIIKDELLASTVDHTMEYYVIAGHNFGYKFLFSSSRAYKKSKGHRVFINLRNGCGKVLVRWSTNFFFCLLMKDRLSAKFESYNCVLCISGYKETVQHLSLDCPFKCYKEMWAKMNIFIRRWYLQHPWLCETTTVASSRKWSSWWVGYRKGIASKLQ